MLESGAAELSLPPTSRAYTRAGQGLYLIGCALILLSYVLEAPLRFGLNAISLDFAIYARDALIIGFAGTTILSWGRQRRAAAPLVLVCVLLAIHTLIGIIALNDLRRPLFGLKIFLPMVLGVVIGPLLHGRVRQVGMFARLCFWLTALGVILNAFVEYPWSGLSFETALGTTDLARKWWSAGVERLPGFTRASYLAAQVILVSLVPLLAAGPRWFMRVLLYGVAATVITLTTSKAAYTGLVALLVCDVLLVVRGGIPLLVGFFSSLYVVCIGLPLFCVQLETSRDVPIWAASFVERMLDMWPRAFALLDSPLSFAVGRGLGGIGSPQQLGEAHLFNTADNVMLFLLVICGVAGPIYIGILVARLVTALAAARRTQAVGWACGWIAILLSVGLTSQMIEDPVTNFSLGLAVALLFQPDG